MICLIPTLIALFIPIGLAWLGLSKTLGAHISWDVKTIIIGAPLGVILSFFLAEKWDDWLKRTVVWIALLIAAYVLALYGKTVFVQSYGDNQMAGKLWYFGWIAMGTGAGGLIYSALKR